MSGGYVKIIEQVQRRIAEEGNPADLGSLVRDVAGGVLSDRDVFQILRKIRHDSDGIGPLESLVALPGVTDVVVNGARDIWFDRGNGLERAAIQFDDDNAVRQLATRLLNASGRRLDDAQCFADGRIARQDGSSLRVHAILSPPSDTGTCISLRVLKQSRAGLDDLCQYGTFSPQTQRIVEQIIDSRRSLLVIGGTGSGKTTLLGALLSRVSPKQRIICIEDTAELKPEHPHCISLVTRAKNTEGKGEITMTDLLKQALRMRPDRIVVGEIRGAEVVDLLAALNTGHEGCAGTVHANSLHEVPARLEALAALGGLSRSALHSQLAAAKPVVLMMKKTPEGRKLQQIGELVGNPTQIKVIWEKNT
ncbi:TadA family conjugal transfer-associated ATPase [Corynebacterium sp. sy039]|uniref:TadA family conjugal transfer-associated ATPase n=1 Tax=Corynebacterium sp. sy039 TaxID=2599641 RepID=UPI0011B4BF26|nr:TadA family conjugal transfer-associated ATPase [Corynebacterium sp. sy039]QDZ43312.1 TadA family conjugal transfer-associated ATPase [Corynebacterium sp. sy039]